MYSVDLLFVFAENGSDMIVSIVYHLLREFMQDQGGKLPRKLHLNLGMYEPVFVFVFDYSSVKLVIPMGKF